jgi:hypothetical protein
MNTVEGITSIGPTRCHTLIDGVGTGDSTTPTHPEHTTLCTISSETERVPAYRHRGH